MDERVLEVQNWLNDTYGSVPGFGYVEPDGFTGWDVVYGLIRALQIELGISTLVDSFGPTTEAEYNNQIGTLKKQNNPSEPTNLNYILQGAFYCKGYNPGGFTGTFYDGTESKVREFQSDIGITATGEVSAKVMKALLNTDGYKWDVLRGGQLYIRSLQQELNRNYAYEPENGWHFDYIPTNGVYGRATNKALIYALQVEEGIGHIANGNFGPSTISECPTLSYGNTGPFVKILQWALACNGVDYYVENFNGVYDDATRNAVTRFQDFMALRGTGIADMGTIKQTMTTNGDTSRRAVACDTSTIINADQARTLKLNGYDFVGRYLTGNVSTDNGIVSKAMTTEELDIIFENELRVFPIFQDGGYKKEYFVPGRGKSDAFKAILAAYRLGFPSGTTIYFAVDFDAYDFEVIDIILPYFREVENVFNTVANSTDLPQYQIGVYGARNTCSRVAGIAKYSFVSDMSTGYSGNLGYPMPENWSFDQFFETPIGSGDGLIRIDKCGYSGRDTGVTYVHSIPDQDPVRMALLEQWIEIGSQVPILSSFFPELFSTEFVFDRTYHLGTINNVEIDVTTQTSTSTITLGADFPMTQVNNGRLVGVTTGELLGEAFKGSVEIDAFSTAENIINGITSGIEVGNIGVKANANELKIEFKAVEESIPVEQIGNIKLGVLISLTIHPSDPNSGDPNYSFAFDPELGYTQAAMFIFLLLLLLGLVTAPA